MRVGRGEHGVGLSAGRREGGWPPAGRPGGETAERQSSATGSGGGRGARCGCAPCGFAEADARIQHEVRRILDGVQPVVVQQLQKLNVVVRVEGARLLRRERRPLLAAGAHGQVLIESVGLDQLVIQPAATRVVAANATQPVLHTLALGGREAARSTGPVRP